MKSAKIRLSEEEQLLVMNGDWILTKNRVLEQVSTFLATLQEEQSSWIREQAPRLPASVLAIPAKLSKGEQYLGLPYRVMDYPRCFGPVDTFAIRTIFWWGHYFTVNLQLAGQWKEETTPALIAAFTEMQEGNVWICTGADPWQHQLSEDAYRPSRAMKREEWEKIILGQAFIKLSARQELSDWEKLGEHLLADFGRLIRATGYAG
jgi:hypothetical protein